MLCLGRAERLVGLDIHSLYSPAVDCVYKADLRFCISAVSSNLSIAWVLLGTTMFWRQILTVKKGCMIRLDVENLGGDERLRP